MKIKPFEKFDLIKVDSGIAPIVDLWDYGLLQNFNSYKKELRNYSYGIYLDKNLNVVQVGPDGDGRILVDKFEIQNDVTKYRKEFLINKHNQYSVAETLSKRFARDRHKAAYKLIKSCNDKEGALFQCWEWFEPWIMPYSNRDRQIVFRIRASYSMFVLVQ